MNLFLRLFFLSLISLESKSQSKTINYIDRFSIPVCYTVSLRDSTPLKNATGFLFKVKSKIYFITNNHVVGGEYFLNDYYEKYKLRPPIDSIPNRLYYRFADDTLNLSTYIVTPLIDEKSKPTWIPFYEDEKDKKGLLDVVAIEFPKTYYSYLDSLNILDFSSINPDLVLTPSSDLFVVGFPYNYGERSIYPVWKRGTVASDAKLNGVGLSTFLIDGTNRPGMSGSPVYFRGHNYATKGVGLNIFNLTTFLIGIYYAQSFDKELGFVIRLDKVYDKLSKLSN